MFCSLSIISFLTVPCQMMKCANWMFPHFKMKDTYSFGWLVGKYCVHTSIFYRDFSVWLNSVVMSPTNKDRTRGICLLFRRGKKSNRWWLLTAHSVTNTYSKINAKVIVSAISTTMNSRELRFTATTNVQIQVENFSKRKKWEDNICPKQYLWIKLSWIFQYLCRSSKQWTTKKGGNGTVTVVQIHVFCAVCHFTLAYCIVCP